MKQTMEKIIDKAYALIAEELGKAGIRCESAADGSIYIDDEAEKTTHCIDISVTECERNEDGETEGGGGKGDYTLSDLAANDIDTWVEGISNMSEIEAVRKEAYAMAGMEIDDDNPVCPAELEEEYNALAEKYGFRFYRDGRIMKYDLTPPCKGTAEMV